MNGSIHRFLCGLAAVFIALPAASQPAPRETNDSRPQAKSALRQAEASILAERHFSVLRAKTGETLDINVEISNSTGAAQSVTLSERPPEGWTVSHITGGGAILGGVINWTVDAEPGTTKVAYKASPATEAKTLWSGSLNGGAEIGGEMHVSLLRAETPQTTLWEPPSGGWDYLYDPDLGSPEDLASDGWFHDNEMDDYRFQPTLTTGSNSGRVWHNPSFIDDEFFGGNAFRLYDPGDPAQMAAYSIQGPGTNRAVVLSYDLGPVTRAVLSMRMRSVPFTDEFGVLIPYGYSDPNQYCLIGLSANRRDAFFDPDTAEELSATGLFLKPDEPNTLSFPLHELYDSLIPGFTDPAWNNTTWHEYWITWNITAGEKSTRLYVDGTLQPKFAFPLQPRDLYYENTPEFLTLQERGAFFNRSPVRENGIPEGNAVCRIALPNVDGAGTVEIDYIALKAGTDEAPREEGAPVRAWELY